GAKYSDKDNNTDSRANICGFFCTLRTKETTPGYTLTPVSSLPSRTTAQQQVKSEPPKSASSPITVARTTPSNSPTSPASAPITEPSPEDAREAVLNSIIEKDLK
ncbi:MAG: hypothetical protein K2L44_05970, partial [Duncaniella sp.]|nr:hypothetical protein [Duncaniella sp.]